MKQAGPPLLEVILQLQFDSVCLPAEKIQYFHRMNGELLAHADSVDKPQVASFRSSDQNEAVAFSDSQAEIRSRQGISYPRLRSQWTRILDSFLDIFGISTLSRVSLAYLNEIPLEDLRSFRNYINIGFDMPSSLNERFEFFRSEFTYKFGFGQIKVWLQPDWDDALQNYCIQLNLESIYGGRVQRSGLLPTIQQLHDGIKEVFRQILSNSYIRQLPQ